VFLRLPFAVRFARQHPFGKIYSLRQFRHLPAQLLELRQDLIVLRRLQARPAVLPGDALGDGGGDRSQTQNVPPKNMKAATASGPFIARSSLASSRSAKVDALAQFADLAPAL